MRVGEAVWIPKREFRMLGKRISDLEMAVQGQKDFNNNIVNAFNILGVNTHILFPESLPKRKGVQPVKHKIYRKAVTLWRNLIWK